MKKSRNKYIPEQKVGVNLNASRRNIVAMKMDYYDFFQPCGLADTVLFETGIMPAEKAFEKYTSAFLLVATWSMSYQ